MPGPALPRCLSLLLFFFNDTATTEIYTLSLHDALPISACRNHSRFRRGPCRNTVARCDRSEEHTSELQSRQYLVCRLLLEKTKKQRQLQSPTNNNKPPHPPS